MFDLIRVTFLTVVNAYRPLFGRPQRLCDLILRPALVALFFIIVIVPFAQQLLLLGLESQPMPEASIIARLANRLPVFLVDMIAIIPWLWLASVLMMRWPHIRRFITPSTTPPAAGLQGKIWRSTALMFGVLSVVALLFETHDQTTEYLDGISGSFHFEATGSLGGAMGFICLILLARYGLFFHGLSIGHPMSFRQSGRRLAGHSYRLFWSLLVVAGAAAYSPITPDRSWFSSVPPIWRSGDADISTGSLFEGAPGMIVSVFMFAFAVCAVSEVMARMYSKTAAQPLELQDQTVSAPA